MNSLNSILIEGNMVRDPLLRSTPKGTSVCNFTIASNRFFRQDSNLEKEVGFFDVETWVKLHFLYLLLSCDFNHILTELENIVQFLEDYSLYFGTEKEEYFDLIDCLFDIVEEVFFYY